MVTLPVVSCAAQPLCVDGRFVLFTSSSLCLLCLAMFAMYAMSSQPCMLDSQVPTLCAHIVVGVGMSRSFGALSLVLHTLPTHAFTLLVSVICSYKVVIALPYLLYYSVATTVSYYLVADGSLTSIS